MSRLNRSEAVRTAIATEQSGTLAELQRRLSLGMINPNPPDLDVGSTAFCTFRSFDTRSYGLYMWVALEGKNKDIAGDIKYHVQVENEEMIWVDAKYVWTKEQAKDLPINPTPPIVPTPSFKDNVVLPAGVVVKDPNAVVQAVLNLLRDAEIKGRMGQTNLAAVRCDVNGLTLGHFYALGDALGTDVCDALNKLKTK